MCALGVCAALLGVVENGLGGVQSTSVMRYHAALQTFAVAASLAGTLGVVGITLRLWWIWSAR